MIGLVAVIYIACCILAFGLHKGAFANHEEFFAEKGLDPNYSSSDDLYCIMSSLLGPISLILFFGMNTVGPESFTSKGMRLCFRMPKELCKQDKEGNEGGSTK